MMLSFFIFPVFIMLFCRNKRLFPVKKEHVFCFIENNPVAVFRYAVVRLAPFAAARKSLPWGAGLCFTMPAFLFRTIFIISVFCDKFFHEKRLCMVKKQLNNVSFNMFLPYCCFAER